MKNKDISIYVPVFNGARTIEKCIISIINQTLKPQKILIIDDCSTDDTINIIKNFSETIEVIQNKENLGLSYSRNLDVNYLKTKYIASIDADIELTNDWLEKIYNIAKTKNVNFICGKTYEKYLGNSCNLWRSLRLKQNWGDNDIIDPKFIFGCNNLLDTKDINLIDAYQNTGEYFKTNGEDIEFSNRLKKKNFKLYYSSSVICHHLQDDNYKSLSNRYWRYVIYGDGLKKRNFFKTLKNSFRQVKKTIRWVIEDLYKFRFNLIIVDFFVLIYFFKNDFILYLKKNDSDT